MTSTKLNSLGIALNCCPGCMVIGAPVKNGLHDAFSKTALAIAEKHPETTGYYVLVCDDCADALYQFDDRAHAAQMVKNVMRLFLEGFTFIFGNVSETDGTLYMPEYLVCECNSIRCEHVQKYEAGYDPFIHARE